MKFNRDLSEGQENIPDQFTMKSMTRYLAKKHGLTGNEARLLIDDYLTMVETGMLMGETVPMGKIGRLYCKIREAQKSRVVKHPATGEDLRIEAKPAMGVPKISFSSHLKERLSRISGESL
jgi:nucleoid DNA-binding protein